MPPSRLLPALVGGALAIILASLGGVAYLTLRTGPLAERLGRDVEALARVRHLRPSHMPPVLPGTFGEQLAPSMDEVLRLYHERPEALQMMGSEWPCLAVLEGRSPVAELPAVCREALEAHRTVLERVLAATHAEEGGLPEGLRSLASPLHPHASEGLFALGYVVRLAGLETRLRLAEGKAAEAVDVCLDSLALSRELATGGGLLGHMLFATGYGVLYRPCADALDAAPLARKRSAVTQLARGAEGFVPFSQMLKEEAALLQLMMFGGLLPAELLAELPEGARDVATQTPEGVRASDSPWGVRLSWRKLVKVFDALVPVADLRPEARRRAFAAIDARHAGELWPVDGPEVDAYGRYAERAELARLQHDALVALVEVDLARTETGRWPEEPPERAAYSFVLEASHPGEARLMPCASELKQHGLRVTADAPSGAWTRTP